MMHICRNAIWWRLKRNIVSVYHCSSSISIPFTQTKFKGNGKHLGKHSQGHNKTENFSCFLQCNFPPLLPKWFSKITNQIYMHEIENGCHINNFVDLFYHALGGAKAKRKPMNDPNTLENDQYHLDFEIVSQRFLNSVDTLWPQST